MYIEKFIQVTFFRTVVWDKNSVSPQGLQDVAAALEKYVLFRVCVCVCVSVFVCVCVCVYSYVNLCTFQCI